jgi:hypothetical protein
MLLSHRAARCALLMLLGLSAHPAAAQTSGLDTRLTNASCLAPASATGGAGVAQQNVFPTAPPFFSPVKILQPPGDATRWFALERAGRIRVLHTANPSVLVSWLDRRTTIDQAGESGLLGMAFHPNWPATPEVYLSYTVTGAPLRTVISRLIVDNTTQPVAPVEQVLLTVDQPYTNHKGGDIEFGADGYLYIGLGDGGSANDPLNLAQDNSRLLGKMLRIHVLGVPFAERYRIPADNPYALNPRCGNYGWRCREAKADLFPGGCGAAARGNQLTTLNAIGLFSPALPAATSLPRLADVTNAGEPQHLRARGYLHSNCSNCHRPGGPTPVDLDLRYTTALQNMRVCNVAPSAGDLGIAGARLVLPGNVAQSVLAQRAARRDANGMPPIASLISGLAGIVLVNDWIRGLGSCTDSDFDVVDDARDNCRLLSNSSQRDSDGDGFGNRCDADLNNDGTVNVTDLSLFRARFGSSDPHADLDGDGTVNSTDLNLMRALFGLPPGPAGL